METLVYQMRCSVLYLARGDKEKAKSKIKSFLQTAHDSLDRDELKEFLRDVVVLQHDVKQLS